MLVKLYTLPSVTPYTVQLATQNIEFRRAAPGDGSVLSSWVQHHFKPFWAVGCEASLTQRPVTCFLAVEVDRTHHVPRHTYDLPEETLLGFACYDVASRGMFGPTGVHPSYRGHGIGAALLITTLQAMASEGYMYAVIGWVEPIEFYAKTVGATVIPDSEPGGFRGPLRGA